MADIAEWLRAALVLLVPIAWYVARSLAAKVNDERLRALLLELVKAAEQIYGPGKGAEKLGYVMREAAARHVPPDLARVEAAVHDLGSTYPYP